MAVKQLLIRMRLNEKRAKLEELRAKDAEFSTRRAEIKTREDELATSIEEASTDEEKAAVETEGATIEAEETQLTTDEAANDAAKKTLTDEIADLERQLSELEANAPKGNPTDTPPAGSNDERKFEHTMSIRTKLFETAEKRDAFFARSEVKEFLTRLRELGAQKRGVTGADLGIPTVVLDLLRDNITRYSKLITRVRYKPVKGAARQNVAGTVPEGIWTESIASLNELELSFTQLEVDGFKCGGYLAIPNAYLEDSDNIQLGMEVLDMMGQAIGLGVDKAIVFGTGSKMPVGFVTRLAASSQPTYWGSKQGTFTDLHATNVITLNINSETGATFFAHLTPSMGVAKPNYSDGQATWIMNRATHIALQAKALAFDAAAALVAGMNNQMPVVGGDIIELEFMGDNEIAGGFLGLYLLVEREGGSVRNSDIPLMIQDATLFVASGRYDGKPIKGEAFIIVSFDNTAPATSTTFGTDYANTDLGVLGVTAAAGTATGDTVLTVTGAESSGTTLKYKIGDVGIARGQKVTGFTALTSGSTQITVAAGKMITVVELDADSKVIKSGKAFAVPKT